MTHCLGKKMEKIDIPSILEFIEMIADTGGGLEGCKASCDLFGLTKDDLIEQVKDIITVGEFYEMAAGRDHLHVRTDLQGECRPETAGRLPSPHATDHGQVLRRHVHRGR